MLDSNKIRKPPLWLPLLHCSFDLVYKLTKDEFHRTQKKLYLQKLWLSMT